METVFKPSVRTNQLSVLASLSILLSLVSFLLSNYATGRIIRDGSTVVLDPADSPVRFLGFAVTGLFVAACLITQRQIRRREFLTLVFIGLTQLACNRLTDLPVLYTWQFAAITVGILWHRIPFHPMTLSVMCWLFVLINFWATVSRPAWAFFRSAEDGPVLIGRLAACTSHPNELGLYSAILALIVSLQVRTKGWRLLWVGLVLLLLLSQSKTSALCFVVAYFAFQRNWRISAPAAVAIPIVSILYAFLAASGLTGGYLSLTGRTNLWSVLIDAAASSPIIGLGPEGVLTASKWVNVGFQAQNHAHDAALQVLVEGGLLGLISYCLFIYFMRKTANRTYLGSAVLLFLLIHSLTESTLPWVWPYPLCFAAAYTLSPQKAVAADWLRIRLFGALRGRRTTPQFE
jgi:exopolysaccharide production protein ExoQ